MTRQRKTENLISWFRSSPWTKIKFLTYPDSKANLNVTNQNIYHLQNGSAIKMSNHSSDSLHICVLNKDELLHTKDAKFAPGIQVSCPYLLCNYKNSQFQQAGRFPSGSKNYFAFLTLNVFFQFSKVQLFNHLKIDIQSDSNLFFYLLLEFLLNHLHSNHKHRRYNGDNLDLTMVVPQVTLKTGFSLILFGLKLTFTYSSSEYENL